MPLAAEETKNPQRDMPRGLIGAMLILAAFAGLILLVGPGGAGSSTLVESGNPIPADGPDFKPTIRFANLRAAADQIIKGT